MDKVVSKYTTIEAMKHFVLLVGIVAFILATPMGASALSVNPLNQTLIGGKVIFTLNCTCNLNPTDKLVFVMGPKSGTFLKSTRTTVYDNNHLRMGSNVIGDAGGGISGSGGCKIYIGTTCTSFGGTYKKINKIGTS